MIAHNTVTIDDPQYCGARGNIGDAADEVFTHILIGICSGCLVQRVYFVSVVG